MCLPKKKLQRRKINNEVTMTTIGAAVITNCLSFDLNCIRQVLSLLDQYDEMNNVYTKETIPEEFIKEIVCSQKLFVESSKESIICLFLRVHSFSKFITSLLHELRVPINTRTIGKLFSCFVKHQTRDTNTKLFLCVLNTRE